MSQIDLFSGPPSSGSGPNPGRVPRDAGIRRAVDAAERREPGWKSDAIRLAKLFMRTPEAAGQFLCEDLRGFAERCGLPEPPSKRAWGAVMQALSRDGIVIKVGTRQVKNRKAHMANATLWTQR